MGTFLDTCSQNNIALILRSVYALYGRKNRGQRGRGRMKLVMISVVKRDRIYQKMIEDAHDRQKWREEVTRLIPLFGQIYMYILYIYALKRITCFIITPCIMICAYQSTYLLVSPLTHFIFPIPLSSIPKPFSVCPRSKV